jgi:hypothetical protein
MFFNFCFFFKIQYVDFIFGCIYFIIIYCLLYFFEGQKKNPDNVKSRKLRLSSRKRKMKVKKFVKEQREKISSAMLKTLRRESEGSDACHRSSSTTEWNFNVISILTPKSNSESENSELSSPLTNVTQPSSTIIPTTTTTTTTRFKSSFSLDLLGEYTDLRFPHLWYPRTRVLRRRVILHVGPTNSGKTHHALMRLLNAPSGIYAAPLRLLAHEVYEKIIAAGVPCSLITGQTVIRNPLARHVSCTVEICDLNTRVAVAVIDEMQLIGDPDRGWSWTRALLGLQADELHLTGDDSAIDLICSLCTKMNDIVEVNYYNRLSPLIPAEIPVGMSLRNLRPGDAVITFSRRDLYLLKRLIERVNPRLKCCVVYGFVLFEHKRFSLPFHSTPFIFRSLGS